MARTKGETMKNDKEELYFGDELQELLSRYTKTESNSNSEYKELISNLIDELLDLRSNLK